jgi:hypothetical protein
MRLLSSIAAMVPLITFIQTIGCTAASEPYTTEGRPGYDLHCNGPRMSWAARSTKAEELCTPFGYDILEQYT